MDLPLPRAPRWQPLLLLLGLLLAACATPAGETTTPAYDEPHPDLSPAEVVRIQTEALQNNDTPTPDSGIELTFRFASPANKVSVGPLERFTELVKNPVYRDLLYAQDIQYGDIEIDGRTAAQEVTVINTAGDPVVFVFFLSQQTRAPCEDCWMTDGVRRMSEQPGGPIDEA